jgi:hypothetical protein
VQHQNEQGGLKKVPLFPLMALFPIEKGRRLFSQVLPPSDEQGAQNDEAGLLKERSCGQGKALR